MMPREIRDNRIRLYSCLATYITEHSERTVIDSDNIEYETWVLLSDASIKEARPFEHIFVSQTVSNFLNDFKPEFCHFNVNSHVFHTFQQVLSLIKEAFKVRALALS